MSWTLCRLPSTRRCVATTYRRLAAQCEACPCRAGSPKESSRVDDGGLASGRRAAQDAALPGAEGAAGAVPNGGRVGSGLGGLLRPTVSEAAVAGVLPDRRFLLPKGAFVDCTLETAIESTLAGMTTCVTATDVWSADGATVLLERGTKLVGETRGGVRQGQRRLFVLWSEARTPNGVTVERASPGTDALGRAGVTGAVDTHFAARFGVVITPSGASDVVSEVLRQTVDIPHTIRRAHTCRCWWRGMSALRRYIGYARR